MTVLFRFHGQPPPPELKKKKKRGVPQATKGEVVERMQQLMQKFETTEQIPEAQVAKLMGSAQQKEVDEEDEAKKRAHEEHMEHLGIMDAVVFFFASLASYYVAEAFHVSGIISALVCGLMCNQCVPRPASSLMFAC